MVMQRTDPPRMVPVGEASQILHVHPNTLRKWSDQGLIPTYRIGQRRDRRFAVEDLVTFLELGGNGHSNGHEQMTVGENKASGSAQPDHD